jgi:hypothetical protein
MIANRLTSPTPMVHLGQWASQFAVAHTLGVQPDVRGDDRIARALDALAPVLEQATGSVGAVAKTVISIEGRDQEQARAEGLASVRAPLL